MGGCWGGSAAAQGAAQRGTQPMQAAATHCCSGPRCQTPRSRFAARRGLGHKGRGGVSCGRHQGVAGCLQSAPAVRVGRDAPPATAPSPRAPECGVAHSKLLGRQLGRLLGGLLRLRAHNHAAAGTLLQPRRGGAEGAPSARHLQAQRSQLIRSTSKLNAPCWPPPWRGARPGGAHEARRARIATHRAHLARRGSLEDLHFGDESCEGEG